MDGRARRVALRSFLVECRARLRPEEVGLASIGRRRVPGLRREEVAELAQISTVWYTLLETARDIRVSPRMLDRLAAALRLNDEEKAYLFSLAINEIPILANEGAESVGAIGREYFELQRFIRRSQVASDVQEFADLTSDLLLDLADNAKIAYFVEANVHVQQFYFTSQRTAQRFPPVAPGPFDFSAVHDARQVLVRGELFTESNVSQAPHAIFRERAVALGSGRFISAGIKSDDFDGAIGYFDGDREPYSERERRRLGLIAEIVMLGLTKRAP